MESLSQASGEAHNYLTKARLGNLVVRCILGKEGGTDLSFFIKGR